MAALVCRQLMVIVNRADSWFPFGDDGTAPPLAAEVVWVICDQQVVADDRFQRRISGIRDSKVEIRMIERTDAPVVIADSHAVLLPVDLENEQRGVLTIRDNRLVSSFHSIFETLWRQSGAPLPDDRLLGARDREILRFLDSGLTDTAAARLAGVSLRTYRRGVADIMQRLDANSRFQAGTAAQRRG